MKRSYFLLVLCLAMLLTGSGAVLAQGPAVDGLVTVQAAASVDETVSLLQSAIQDRGLTVLSTVNHAANAQGVGQDLRPTQLIIFGNPNLGTQLMQNQQSVGIDLPQKILVWEDEVGQVNASYNDPQYLQNRHNLTGLDDVLATTSNALGGLSSTVMPAETESMTPAESAPTTMPASGADVTSQAVVANGWGAFAGGHGLAAATAWLV